MEWTLLSRSTFSAKKERNMSEKKVLEMKGITKIYPGVRALDGA